MERPLGWWTFFRMPLVYLDLHGLGGRFLSVNQISIKHRFPFPSEAPHPSLHPLDLVATEPDLARIGS
jgi:hypothetical protein